MSSRQYLVKSTATTNHHGGSHPSVTSGISSSSAAASGNGSRSASIRDLGVISPLIKSSAYTDEQEEEDTDTTRSKPSHVFCGSQADAMVDRTTVNLVVTAEVFPKVKFVDRDTDLAFTENKKSICQFVISRCNLHADINIATWWKHVQKYVAQTINRLRNDRNTAMKWAVLGKCHSML